MSRCAELLTWPDLEKRCADIVAKIESKYEVMNCVFFTNADARNVFRSHVDVARNSDLKIFILGHGMTGSDHITSDDGTRQQTLAQLIDLLEHGLKDRANSMDTCANTVVNMLSCLFGRSVDAMPNSSCAYKLHSGLAAKNVFVNLVARTMVMNPTSEGSTTLSALLVGLNKPVVRGGEDPSYDPNEAPVRKGRYTKVLYTYENRARVVRYISYDPSLPNIEESSLEGNRLMWADWVVDRIAVNLKQRLMQERALALDKTRNWKVTFPPHVDLLQIGLNYEKNHSAEQLKAALDAFVAKRQKDPQSFAQWAGLDATPIEIARNWLKRYPS